MTKREDAPPEPVKVKPRAKPKRKPPSKVKKGLPEYVWVGPLRYEVTVDEARVNAHAVAEQSTIRAFADTYELRIWIREMHPAQQRITLIHEVLHLVSAASGLNMLDWNDSNHDEDICQHLDSGLTDVLRSNPELIRFLTEDSLA